MEKALAPFDAEARKEGAGWESPDWDWTNSVIWTAARSPVLMAVIAASRSYYKRSEWVDDAGLDDRIPAMLLTLAETEAPGSALDAADQELRRLCRDGVVTAYDLAGAAINRERWQPMASFASDARPAVVIRSADLLAVLPALSSSAMIARTPPAKTGAGRNKARSKEIDAQIRAIFARSHDLLASDGQTEVSRAEHVITLWKGDNPPGKNTVARRWNEWLIARADEARQPTNGQ